MKSYKTGQVHTKLQGESRLTSISIAPESFTIIGQRLGMWLGKKLRKNNMLVFSAEYNWPLRGVLVENETI